VTPEVFFAGCPEALAVFETVRTVLGEHGPYSVRTSKSQVAFRRRRGFAFIWVPGQYLRNPAAKVVLSIVLARHEQSPRFKQVAHPAPRIWMHHLELNDASAIDDQVAHWLREAADSAA
jgi:Domain of unknown function (DUF5655)